MTKSVNKNELKVLKKIPFCNIPAFKSKQKRVLSMRRHTFKVSLYYFSKLPKVNEVLERLSPLL